MDGDNIAVDDLFNAEDLDHAALNIPISANDVTEVPVQPQLLDFRLRLNDLHINGCRQKTAWSRMGAIACISEDSHSVSIQCLKFNRNSALWELSSKHILELPIDDVGSRRYIHIMWSAGTDLAILDTQGRVAIFTMSTGAAVNRFIELRSPNLDPGDELNQAVGVFWLPPSERELPIISQLSKQEDRWTQVMTKRKPFGPAWPRALLIVTRTGAVRLLKMQLDRTWSETDASLDTAITSKDFLTHAACASTIEGTILITTQNMNKKISVYSLQVNPPNPSQDPSSTLPMNLQIEHIKSNLHDGRMNNADAAGDLLNSDTGFDHDISSLSHLEIVPTSDVEKSVQVPPTIFAVNTTFSSDAGIGNSLQPRASIIRRWSLYTVEQKLHPRFDEIAAKVATGTSPKTITDLQRLPDVNFEQVITSFHLVDSGQSLAITTQDGTTSFYNPSTMSQLFYESDPKEATSLSQCGFAFPPTNCPFTIAFSPNACAAITLSSTAQLSTMEHHAGLRPDSTDPTLDAALAALILAYTRASYSAITTDDLLACILSTIRPTHIPTLLLLMIQCLFRDADFIPTTTDGSELEKLPQKPVVAKVLSLHSNLGSIATTSTPQRTLAAQYAWMTLNIRHVALQLFYVISAAKGKDHFPTDLVPVGCNNVRWAMDLFRMLVDELFEVLDQENADAARPTRTTRALVELLLTGLWSRYFMKMIARVIRMMAATKDPQQVAQIGPIMRIIETMQGRGLKLAGLERLLDAADRFVETGDARAERELMATGKIEGGYNGGNGLLGRLAREILPGMRQNGEVDRLGIYTGEYEWVLLEKGTGENSKQVLDVHRKKFIRMSGGSGEIRRCVRCGSVSEDVHGPKRDWPKWIQTQMMRCICEANFVIEEFEY